MKATVTNLNRYTNKRDRALFDLNKMKSDGLDVFRAEIVDDLTQAIKAPYPADKEIVALKDERDAIDHILNSRFTSDLSKLF